MKYLITTIIGALITGWSIFYWVNNITPLTLEQVKSRAYKKCVNDYISYGKTKFNLDDCLKLK